MKTTTLAALLATGLFTAPMSGPLAAPSPLPTDQVPAFICANKNSGVTRIPDHLRNKSCRRNEVAYRGALRVFDGNRQFLGFADPGSNDPYSAKIYAPSLKQYVYLFRAYDASSPDKQSLTLGDVYTPTERTTYYSAANCAGQSYVPSGSGYYVYKDPATGSYYQIAGQLVAATVLSRKNETYNTGTGWTGTCTNSTSQRVLLPNSPAQVSLPLATPFPLPLSYE